MLKLQRQSVSWLLAEFIVVVLGVAVALAADSWRESLQELEIEQDYLERLISDLDYGCETLGRAVVRVQEAGESAARLLMYIEKRYSYDNELAVIEDFRVAGNTGGRGNLWSHDLAYDELVSTGRFGLIRNTALRSAITDYYRRVDYLLGIRAELPVYIEDRLTLIRLTDASLSVSTGAQQFSENQVQRILSDLDDESIAQELRSIAIASDGVSGPFRQSGTETGR